jgi:hypothetical protein
MERLRIVFGGAQFSKAEQPMQQPGTFEAGQFANKKECSQRPRATTHTFSLALPVPAIRAVDRWQVVRQGPKVPCSG